MKIVGTMTVEIPYIYDLGRVDDELLLMDFEAARVLLDDWRQTAADIASDHRGRVTKLEIHSVSG